MGTRRDVASRRSAPSGDVATTTLQRGPFSRCQKVPFLLAISNDGLLPPEGVARRVVLPVAHRDRPLHHGTDPLAHPPRSLGLVVPDR